MASMVIWNCPQTGVEAIWNKGDFYTVHIPRPSFPEHGNMLTSTGRGHAIAKAKRWARKLKRERDAEPDWNKLWYDTSAELK